MWFEKLLGFREKHPQQVRENIMIEGEYLISKVTGNKFRHGQLLIPTLQELGTQSSDLQKYNNKITVEEVTGNVSVLHEENPNATFQAASQFNLLEMVSPHVTPESGVDIYENDYTQGPACAITCGAGTIYRNYFVNVGGQIGQTRDLQVDCLKDIGDYFQNEDLKLWIMENGYAFPTREGLELSLIHI